MTNSYNDKSQSLLTMYINHYIIEFPKLHQQTPWSTNINNVSSFITLHTVTTLQANLFSADVFCGFRHSFFSCSASAGPWSQETPGLEGARWCGTFLSPTYRKKMVKCMPKTTPLRFFWVWRFLEGTPTLVFGTTQASIEGTTGNPQRWTPAHVPTKPLCPIPNQSKHLGTYLYISKVNKLIHPK